METLNVYYNAGSDSGWSNESRAWDSSLSTAATISIAKSTNDTSHYLLNSTVTTSEPAGNYTITKVEICIRCKSSGYSNQQIKCIPKFGGSTSGSTYTSAIGMSATTYKFDITSDGSGPGSGSWKWSDITGLDITTWGNNASSISAYTFSVYEVWILLTYSLNYKLYYRKNNSSTAITLYDNADDILYPVGVRVQATTLYAQAKSNGDTSLYARVGGKTLKLKSTKTADAALETEGKPGAGGGGSGTASANTLYVNKFTSGAHGGTIKSVYWHAGGYSGTAIIKFLIFNSDGEILYNSGQLSFTINSDSDGYTLVNLPTSYSMAGSTAFYFGYIVSKGNYSYTTDTGNGGYIANNYGTPTNFDPASLSSTSNRYKVYAKAKYAL